MPRRKRHIQKLIDANRARSNGTAPSSIGPEKQNQVHQLLQEQDPPYMYAKPPAVDLSGFLDDYYADDRMIRDLKTNLETFLPTYNELLDFTPRLSAEAHLRHNTQIQNICDNIHVLFSQYKEQVLALGDALHQGISSLKQSIRDDVHFYDNSEMNLLFLETWSLQELLDENPIRDPEHFQQYLLRIVPEELKRGMSHKTRDIDAFEKKLLMLQRALCPSYGSPKTHELSLHLCLAWSAELANYDDWVLRPTCIKLCRLAREDFRHRPSLWRPSDWWDMAAARRQLFRSYDTIKCAYRKNPLWDRGIPMCYHGDTIPLLDMMWSDASDDTSQRVRIAVGHVLPAELTELVIDFTLLAEDLGPDRRFQHYDPKLKCQVGTPEHLKCGNMKVNPDEHPFEGESPDENAFDVEDGPPEEDDDADDMDDEY